MKILTFGEIMLRLKAPGHERFFQSPMLEATFGGGEANVAVSLANYGMDAEFLTVLPQNDIANACIRELRYFGVDTKKIVRGDGRMGIYYLEAGANQLPSEVVYDRAYSSIALVFCVIKHQRPAHFQSRAPVFRLEAPDGTLQTQPAMRCSTGKAQ